MLTGHTSIVVANIRLATSWVLMPERAVKAYEPEAGRLWQLHFWTGTVVLGAWYLPSYRLEHRGGCIHRFQPAVTNIVATITLSVSLVPYKIVWPLWAVSNWNTYALDSFITTRFISGMRTSKPLERFSILIVPRFAFLLSSLGHGYITAAAIVLRQCHCVNFITTDVVFVVDRHAS